MVNYKGCKECNAKTTLKTAEYRREEDEEDATEDISFERKLFQRCTVKHRDLRYLGLVNPSVPSPPPPPSLYFIVLVTIRS